jgi:O-antigen ligase
LPAIDKDYLGAAKKERTLSGAFFWLSAFYLVYCLRPEDWVPGLGYVPMAKITGVFAILGLLSSLGKTERGFKDLPREAKYLFLIIALMLLSAVLSPVWRGGALVHTIDFSKVFIAWTLTFLLITSTPRLKRIIFIQAASVAAVSAIVLVKGHDVPRLDGVLGGIYGNPNDLAFAIVLSLPISLALMVTSRGVLPKIAWLFSMLVMLTALFLTASRAGFITLIISGAVCLWHFGIKGRRPQLIVVVVSVCMLLGVVAGGRLKDRFFAMSGDVQNREEQSAYGSYEERRFLMLRSLEGIEHYPILGIGVHNFATYSTKWKQVHNSYLQIAVEGGIPVLVLYLMFFGRGFKNLKLLRQRRDLDRETTLLVGALHSSLIGFSVGALFAPEAYQFFPYFAVAYTSVIFAIVKERKQAEVPTKDSPTQLLHRTQIYATNGRPNALTPVR